MKNIFLSLIGTVMLFSFAGKGSLPKNIEVKINNRYPNAHIKGWEMKNDEYVIKIGQDKKKMMAFYSEGGNWIKTEEHISLSKDLPLAVKKGFDNSKYVSWHIDNIKKVLMRDASPMYILHVDNGDKLDADHIDAFKNDVLLSFDTEGVLVHLE